MSNSEDITKTLLSLVSDETSTQIDQRVRLRQLVLSVRQVELVGKLSEESMAAIYVARSLLNDLYRNVGTDATFSFPEDLVASQKVLDHLKGFIRELLADSGGSSTRAMSYLCRAVNSYYSVLNEIGRNIDKYK